MCMHIIYSLTHDIDDNYYRLYIHVHTYIIYLLSFVQVCTRLIYGSRAEKKPTATSRRDINRLIILLLL